MTDVPPTEHADPESANPLPSKPAIKPTVKPTMNMLLRDPIMLLAFGFGSGLSPKAPGTAGSFLALLFMPVLALLPVWGYLLMLALAIGAGILICDYADSRLDGHDHSGIVWDEFAGLWLTLACVPASWTWWLFGFVIFRCFDILKPWPISVIDRKISGGVGVMLDDLLAGLGAWIVVMIVIMMVG